MSEIKFSKEQKEILVNKMTQYFETELSQDIGQFDCEFLLDFISKEMGAFYYNKGLVDAQAILSNKVDDLMFAIDEIKKPISF